MIFHRLIHNIDPCIEDINILEDMRILIDIKRIIIKLDTAKYHALFTSHDRQSITKLMGYKSKIYSCRKCIYRIRYGAHAHIKELSESITDTAIDIAQNLQP